MYSYFVMSCKRVLLNKLIHIELYNLKNICPIVHKINEHNYSQPLTKYHINNNNNFISYDNTEITLNHVYLINGFNKPMSLLSHIIHKYKYDKIYCGVVEKCNDCKYT